MNDSSNLGRWIAYPIAGAIVAGLGWAAFGYRAEADFMTLVSSASIHAELAAAIPGHSDNVKGSELRRKLIGDAYGFLERADRVEPDTAAACQVRAFLKSTEGDYRSAADLYRRCRTMSDCQPEERGELVIREAKSLSNAGEASGALALLAQHENEFGDEDQVELSALRARLSFRVGDRDAALRHTAAIEAATTADGHDHLVAADLYEGLGDYVAAESAYRKSELRVEVRDYVIARLKLRSGDADTARSMLSDSARDRDPEVMRLIEADDDLWMEEIGADEFRELTGPAEAAPAPSAGR